ncbi:hypothetical protein [Azospirillum rugosum]|uniref:Uncharacterized protein n=1 Tax=Azospirillum rugosum TaxID=416170 RepID=A0ABS4SKQ9_9PROT|nr:hypothetical protein [Azospirillum rugosum]MBP2293145.1 hypothetical protein [Azospirillum rugosum]MDQ0526694.1 hypothetical protein [Azospirillum rugosum]
MTNGDVLWAWIAGIAVSITVLVALSQAKKPYDTIVADRILTLPDAPLGAQQWDVEAWERTGGTPPRAHVQDTLHDVIDALEIVLPDGNPAVAEEPAKAW